MGEETPENIDFKNFAKIMQLAFMNSAFRKGLGINPIDTINAFESHLGFATKDLSNELLDTIGSLSYEELSLMAEIKTKVEEKLQLQTETTVDKAIGGHWF